MSDTLGQNPDSYDDTPHGWAKRWSVELTAAEQWLSAWRDKGEKIEKRYRDERDGTQDALRRLNLFPANEQTKEAILYGKIPKATVSRKFQDQEDEVARKAADIAERAVNCDIARPIDTYARALARALKDRRLAGLGQCRVYYRPTTRRVEEQPEGTDDKGNKLEAVPAYDEVTNEEAEVVFIYWRDQLWSPCEREEDKRWWAHKSLMDRKQLRARFSEVVAPSTEGAKPLVIGDLVPLNAKEKKDGSPLQEDPWARAEVWEIWSKEHGEKFWFVRGFDRILDRQKGTEGLNLDGFWPTPDPMAANLHNGTTIPQPDFHLAQDQYNAADLLTTRIDDLVAIVKAAGLYDGQMGPEVERLVQPGRSELIPQPNWALHAEKGGLRNRIDWLPIDMLVSVIDKLREIRTEEVELAYQVSGMPDIARGQQTENGTPGEGQLKARYASVRMQQLSEEFAKFATELLRLKFEVMAKHCSVETWLKKSNAAQMPEWKTPDGQRLILGAIALLKSNYADYRIEIKPDSLAAEDFAAKQAEAGQALAALSSFLSAAAPITQFMPSSLPYLLKLLQAAMANYQWFSNRAEPVFDAAVADAEKVAANPQPQPTDPKLQTAQLKLVSDREKAFADLRKEEFKYQADISRMQMETEQKKVQEINQMEANVAETRAKSLVAKANRPPDAQGGVPK